LKALVYWPGAPPRVAEYLVSGLSRILETDTAYNFDDALTRVRYVEVFVGQLNNALLREARRLRFAQVTSAGVDHLDLGLARRKGVLMASAKGVNSFYVAELALSLMLALAKRLVELDRKAKENVFPGYDWSGWSIGTLKNKTVLVYGYGGIGRELARLLEPFGAKIIGVRRGAESEYYDGHVKVVPPSGTLKYIGEADFLVIAVPLTEETREAIDRNLLSRMKKGSYVINVSRGDVLSEEALYEALTSGRLAGAGIDVWWVYPGERQGTVYSHRGVHRLPNVIAVPHRGGFVEEAFMEVASFAISNVERFIKGEEPISLVDYEKGY